MIGTEIGDWAQCTCASTRQLSLPIRDFDCPSPLFHNRYFPVQIEIFLAPTRTRSTLPSSPAHESQVIVPPASAAKAAYVCQTGKQYRADHTNCWTNCKHLKKYTTLRENNKNKAEASSATERCSLLSEIIMKCFDGNASLNQQQLQGIRLLHGQLKEMLSLVKAYCLQHSVLQALTSDSFEQKYDIINKRIDEYTQMLQLSMQTSVFHQTNQIYEILTGATKLDANNQKLLDSGLGTLGPSIPAPLM